MLFRSWSSALSILRARKATSRLQGMKIAIVGATTSNSSRKAEDSRQIVPRGLRPLNVVESYPFPLLKTLFVSWPRSGSGFPSFTAVPAEQRMAEWAWPCCPASLRRARTSHSLGRARRTSRRVASGISTTWRESDEDQRRCHGQLLLCAIQIKP